MSFPLAYMITWRCYGTWLHGDPRGSVDSTHNIFGTPLLAPDPQRRRRDRSFVIGGAMTLTDERRASVNQTINAHCHIRHWEPLAVNVRTNHVHTVVACGEIEPEPVLNQFKVWSTRGLRDAKLVSEEAKVWAKGGSKKYLWTKADIEAAIRYVLEAQ